MSASSRAAGRLLPEGEPLAVRPLTITDGEAAATVIRTAFAVQRRVTDPPSSALRETAEAVAGKIAAGGGFAAVSDGRLVAVALWQPDGDALMVGRVCALPEARGQGLVRRLLSACESFALALGVERLRLRVRLELPENEALFRRLGFARVGVETHAGFDRPTVAVMEKSLP